MHLALVPLLAEAFTFVAGDRTEFRSRTDPSGTFADVVTVAQASMNLNLRRTNWTLMYSPSVTEMSIGTNTSGRYIFHVLSLSAQLRISPRTSLNWSESAMYGQQNFRLQTVSAATPTANSASNGGQTGTPPNNPATGTTPGTAGIAPIQGALENRTIQFGSLISNLGLQHSLGRTWSTGLNASYMLIGELDSYVPAIYPRTRMYQLGGNLSHRLGPSDQITFTETNTLSLIEPNAHASISTAGLTWNHQATRHIATTLFGLGSYVYSKDLTGRDTSALLPGFGGSALASTAVRPRPSRLTAVVTGAVSPVIDYLYGSVNNVATGSVEGIWRMNRLTLQVSGMAARSLNTNAAISMISAYTLTESLSYGLDRSMHWTLSTGSRQAMQTFSNGQQVPLTWVTFVGLAYTTGPVRL